MEANVKKKKSDFGEINGGCHQKTNKVFKCISQMIEMYALATAATLAGYIHN